MNGLKRTRPTGNRISGRSSTKRKCFIRQAYIHRRQKVLPCMAWNLIWPTFRLMLGSRNSFRKRMQIWRKNWSGLRTNGIRFSISKKRLSKCWSASSLLRLRSFASRSRWQKRSSVWFLNSAKLLLWELKTMRLKPSKLSSNGSRSLLPVSRSWPTDYHPHNLLLRRWIPISRNSWMVLKGNIMMQRLRMWRCMLSA